MDTQRYPTHGPARPDLDLRMAGFVRLTACAPGKEAGSGRAVVTVAGARELKYRAGDLYARP